MSLVLLSVLFAPTVADVITAGLTFITWLWIANLSITSFAGVFKMRQAAAVDWHAMLHEMPDEAKVGVKHIVLLPNFQENERMLKERRWTTWRAVD
ncbi:unnamed protein product [Effrenium voratum]|nr:unnamed protein product [Effrenium voratum]